MSNYDKGASLKVYPILFSPAMVRALLNGSKTQTRRIIEPQPSKLPGFCDVVGDLPECAYGTRNDLLWVKEPWQAWTEFDDKQPNEIPENSDILYVADREDTLWDARRRHARFMCRWMSRLTLELSSVRVERLQDINEEDAIAEGIRVDDCGHAIRENDDIAWGSAKGAYAELWESLHGEGSWDANPFVWVLSFNVIHSNVDEVLKSRRIAA